MQQTKGFGSNPLGNASAAECAQLGGTFIKESEIKWVRTFRVLRALRPLRVIKRTRAEASGKQSIQIDSNVGKY